MFDVMRHEITVPIHLSKVAHKIDPHFVDAAFAAQLKPLDAQLRRRNAPAESAALRCAA